MYLPSYSTHSFIVRKTIKGTLLEVEKRTSSVIVLSRLLIEHLAINSLIRTLGVMLLPISNLGGTLYDVPTYTYILKWSSLFLSVSLAWIVRNSMCTQADRDRRYEIVYSLFDPLPQFSLSQIYCKVWSILAAATQSQTDLIAVNPRRSRKLWIRSLPHVRKSIYSISEWCF